MCKKNNGRATAAIVDRGGVPKIFATGIIAVDHGDGYVQITFCCDQMWGSEHVQEREIGGRVILTPHAWHELQAVLAPSLDESARQEEAGPVH